MHSKSQNKTLLGLCLGISLSITGACMAPSTYAAEPPTDFPFSDLRAIQERIRNKNKGKPDCKNKRDYIIGRPMARVSNQLISNIDHLPSEVQEIVEEYRIHPFKMFEKILALEVEEQDATETSVVSTTQEEDKLLHTLKETSDSSSHVVTTSSGSEIQATT